MADRHLGPDEFDRLLDGRGGHRGLRRLLDAAAAPGGHSELAGERDAVAAFSAAMAAPPEIAVARPRRRSRSYVLRCALAAVTVAGTASGGVAIAAGGAVPVGDSPPTTETDLRPGSHPAPPDPVTAPVTGADVVNGCACTPAPATPATHAPHATKKPAPPAKPHRSPPKDTSSDEQGDHGDS